MAKNQQAEKQNSKRRKSPEELRLNRYNQLAEGMDSATLPLLEGIYESTMKIVQVTLKIKPNGQWLSIAKRDTADGPEVLFSGGDDFIESIIRLSEKVQKGQWKVDTPYDPKKSNKK